MTDYLADLESDFSRYHGIDDMYAMDGPRFMRFAWRISVYGGVMALRINTQEPEKDVYTPPAESNKPAHQLAGPKHDNVTWISPAAFAMMHGQGGAG